MDPQETLLELLEAMKDQDRHMSKIFLMTLYDWLDKGGHFPEVSKDKDGNYVVKVTLS